MEPDKTPYGKFTDVLTRSLTEAHKRGYADGLEAAANTVRDSAMPYDQLAILLEQESNRVREMGVNNG